MLARATKKTVPANATWGPSLKKVSEAIVDIPNFIMPTLRTTAGTLRLRSPFWKDKTVAQCENDQLHAHPETISASDFVL